MLFQFLSQRNLGSISYHKVEEKSQRIEREDGNTFASLVPVPSSYDNYLCRLDLQNSPEKLLSSIQADSSSSNKTALLQKDLKKEVTLYFSNGSKGYVGLNVPPSPIINSYEKKMILLSESTKEPAPEPQKSPDGKPSQSQVDRVFNVLSETVSVQKNVFLIV